MLSKVASLLRYSPAPICSDGSFGIRIRHLVEPFTPPLPGILFHPFGTSSKRQTQMNTLFLVRWFYSCWRLILSAIQPRPDSTRVDTKLSTVRMGHGEGVQSANRLFEVLSQYLGDSTVETTTPVRGLRSTERG